MDNWHRLSTLAWRLCAGLEPNEKGCLKPILEGVYQELSKHGFDMWRVALGIETLHPVRGGDQFVLLNGAVENQPATRAVNSENRYLNSPTFVVDETWKTFRWRAEDDTRGMGLLEEFKRDGVTDYLLVPLPFQDITRTATLSTTTRKPGGYSDEDVTLFHLAAQLISPYAERIALREVAVNMLKTYVGPRSGERVLDGAIDRGEAETITAAVLFGDLRGFTSFTNQARAADVLQHLNRWFDIFGDAVTENHGEILKFMGDGVLALFPVGQQGQQAACGRALAAARSIAHGSKDLPSLHEKTTPKLGEQKFSAPKFGLGLHIGEVAYGNVGSKLRLDFTVIGPAVNLASRIEAKTKALGAPILASQAFKMAVEEDLTSVGQHHLTGFDEAQELYKVT